MNAHDVCIVDYGMGNLMSVLRAFERIGCTVKVSNQIADLEAARRIILPGVGAFSVAMDNLHALGLIPVLEKKIMREKTPFLGICLGMQLIAEDSYENGHFQGLGWVPASVIKLKTDGGLRVPHMGWSELVPTSREQTLYSGIEGEMSYYFVHSYHVDCRDERYVGSTCQYGQTFTSSIQFENIYATQFHPEKSQKNGIALLQNFIALTATDLV